MPGILQRCSCVLAALLVFSFGLSARAQAPIVEEPDYTPTLTFDVVSIHLAPPPGPGFRVVVSSPPDSSRFDVTNLPTKALLQIAYGFAAPIVDAPDWISDAFYDIQARSGEAEDARLAKLTPNEVRLEKRHAIRVLLAQRYALKTHMETRNSAIFNLVLAKGGIRMKANPAPSTEDAGARQPVGDVVAHPSQHGLEFVGSNESIQAITGVLSSMMEAPVMDKTGLSGRYNFTLQFGREWSQRDPDSWPPLVTAVQEQLGLKLESLHQSVPNLVIDHLSKPTDN